MDRDTIEMHEQANSKLWAMLPQDQIDRVFAADMCDIDPSFLGFVGIYEALSRIIPKSWTVVDLGCSYAPQSFFFANHAGYVGVDIITPVEHRFAPENARHHEMSIRQFVAKHAASFLRESTFAICSYVPPWDGDNMELARTHFQKVFTYYPHGDDHSRTVANAFQGAA